MALLSTMVERIAEVEGVETAFASGIARYLREAGMITQAGRGRGAAHMNSFDAARFIIGLNASITAKEAPDYVKYFQALRNVWDTQEFRGVCIANQTLLSAIVSLIEICSHTELEDRLRRTDLEVSIQFNRPVAHVLVQIDDTRWDEHGVPDTRCIAKGLYGSPIALVSVKIPDRRETITISQRTLLVAADVIAN